MGFAHLVSTPTIDTTVSTIIDFLTGWSIPLSLLAVILIHPNLSYPTVPGILPDPFLRIWLDRIYKDKHGSDSMSYDTEGRFRPQNFEDIFAKYDRDGKGGLTIADLWSFWNGQKMVFDFFGWSATALECKALQCPDSSSRVHR